MSWRGALARVRPAPALLLAGIAMAEYGLPGRPEGRALTLALATILTVGFVRHSVGRLRSGAGLGPLVRARAPELALTAAALALLLSKALVWGRELLDPGRVPALDLAYRQYAGAFLLVAGARVLAGGFPVRRILYRLELRPAQTVALGFATAVLAGTLLLSLPVAVVRLDQLSLLDALFTATSAVTVTGLVVHEPGRFYTPFGQAVLLGLIQLGGLGTMAASASLVVLAGRRLRLQRAAALQESMDLETLGQVRGHLRALVAVTVLVEAAGAVALGLVWWGRAEVDRPAAAAVFHAVSAFCNAGFSTLPGGLLAFRDDVATTGIMAALIVLGGLGFPVLLTARRLVRSGLADGGRPHLTLHARLVFLMTGVLLAGGTLAFLLLEWRGTLRGQPWGSRLLTAGFLAVTARTAGFSTVETAALSPAAVWLLMLLMFVGGSPGSTAGGIKTTTVATVVAALVAVFRGRPRVEAFRRTLPDEQVTKALAVVGVSAAAVAITVVLLLASQDAEPLALTVEAVSAFGTVGLSMGVTAGLDGWGKLLVAAAMFVGRTGPLTLGFALARRAAPVRVTFPAERIMIG